jgi:3-oxoacyl-[acyl-carrier protein] reductase
MAYEAGTPLKAEDMIQPEDIAKTVTWLLSLSSSARIKEVVIECKNHLL